MFTKRENVQGVPSPRSGRDRKQFELAVDRVLGERIRADGAAAIDMWSALANVEWRSSEGLIASYSSRSAGALVAWVCEDGDYMDWYCSGPVGVVSPWIAEALAHEGWSWSVSAKSGEDN